MNKVTENVGIIVNNMLNKSLPPTMKLTLIFIGAILSRAFRYKLLWTKTGYPKWDKTGY